MESAPTGHTKSQKEMVRKRSQSGMNKAVQTGVLCNTFVAYVFWNPTHKKLQGAFHLPQGMDMPNITKFIKNLSQPAESLVPKRRKRNIYKTKNFRDSDLLDEIVVESSHCSDSTVEMDTDDKSQNSPNEISSSNDTCCEISQILQHVDHGSLSATITDQQARTEAVDDIRTSGDFDEIQGLPYIEHSSHMINTTTTSANPIEDSPVGEVQMRNKTTSPSLQSIHSQHYYRGDGYGSETLSLARINHNTLQEALKIIMDFKEILKA